MQINKKTSVRAIIRINLIVLIISCGIAAVTTYFLYEHTKDLLKSNLKERLLSVVATASTLINQKDIVQISGPESVNTNSYKNIVIQLQNIRNYNKNIKYAYILNKTSDPNTFTYIADADSMDPAAIVDLNDDGIFGGEEDQLVKPGDDYDVSEIPALRNEAWKYPVTDLDPVGDQWGLFLSAYAPILSNGDTIGIIGIDVEVTDYIKRISRTYIPFVLFVVFLLILLSLQTLSLIRMWNSQLRILEEIDRQKDELMSLVSHQLATPVSSMKWYTEMMLDGDLGDLSKEQKEHIKTMHSLGENLSDLVGMILDVSRIQLGRMRLDAQELDLSELFKEIIDTVEPKVEEKQLSFKKHLPHHWPKAKLDKRYARMSIENLLTNAVKYTPENGTVELKVDVKDHLLHIEVKDTGCGIPKEDQDKIFGRMFRASNVRNSKTDGNGFGLYIVKGAVEAQGGKIWFESEEGKGTTFFLQLPLVHTVKA